MKRKFSLFLNVAVLALCVCAIAIGVYSAKQASLNVSGTVGFTAHDCTVAVTGTIVGHSTTADGAPETTPQAIEGVTVKDTKTLNLGTIYFSDITNDGTINPITLTLNFENLSDFDVVVTITAKVIADIVTTPDKTSVILANKRATEAEKKKTVVLTLACAGRSTSITPAEKQILQINMEKYTGLTVSQASNFFWNNTSDNTRSYVTMGKYNSLVNLRWYIFAKGDADGSNMQAVTGAVETNADNTLKAGTYWFISEHVLDDISAIQFDDSSNVYGTSDIKAYLDGTGTGTFANKYGITEEDAVYSKIDTRTLPAEEANGDVGAFTEVADQKLWLLSVSELKYLNNGTACVPFGTYTTLYAKNADLQGAVWWLRSPYNNHSDSVFYAASIIKYEEVIINIPGVRPAFQVTIN